ncbi:unnamed protein product, partial [marine sediment metagenome]
KTCTYHVSITMKYHPLSGDFIVTGLCVALSESALGRVALGRRDDAK